MLADQRLQRPDDVRVAAEGEPRLDELLVRRDPQLVEPGDGGLRERLVREVGERGAAPEDEGALERGGRGRRMAGGELPAALLEEILEAAGVELLGRERQDVPVLPGGQRGPAVREGLAQARDLHVERARGGRRRALAPQRVHDPVGGQHLVRMQEQQREQRPAAAAAERDDPSLVEHLERAEDAELHAGRGGCRGRNAIRAVPAIASRG